jgi:hypothetical protein
MPLFFNRWSYRLSLVDTSAFMSLAAESRVVLPVLCSQARYPRLQKSMRMLLIWASIHVVHQATVKVQCRFGCSSTSVLRSYIPWPHSLVKVDILFCSPLCTILLLCTELFLSWLLSKISYCLDGIIAGLARGPTLIRVPSPPSNDLSVPWTVSCFVSQNG